MTGIHSSIITHITTAAAAAIVVIVTYSTAWHSPSAIYLWCFLVVDIDIRYFQWSCIFAIGSTNSHLIWLLIMRREQVLYTHSSEYRFLLLIFLFPSLSLSFFLLLCTCRATVKCLLSCSSWLAIAFNLNMAIIKSIPCWHKTEKTAAAFTSTILIHLLPCSVFIWLRNLIFFAY